MKAWWPLYIVACLFLMGCSKGFKGSVGNLSSVQIQAGDGIDLPDSDKLDPDCMTSTSYDTCLFLKNPVFHSGRTFSGIAASQLDPFQTLGVKLTGLASTGFLENSDYSIQTTRSPRLLVARLDGLRLRYSAAQSSQIEQLMTYYYYRMALDFWGPRGMIAVQGRAVNVIVDSSMSGFEKSTNTIHLLKSTKTWPMALDSSQSIYLLATANIHYATGGRINNFGSVDANHQFCGSDAKGCCKTEAGCSRALISGLSTYFVASVFPARTAIGELSANRLGGVRLCGTVDRNVALAASLTRASAFGACATRRGDVHIMGNLYASVFWEVKKALPNEARAVDRLYIEHLSSLSAEDTFITAKEKLFLSNSETLTSSLRTVFTAEFSRRGY